MTVVDRELRHTSRTRLRCLGDSALAETPVDTFVDPRNDPAPVKNKPPPRTTAATEELAQLHRLCREGRLYEAERWIRAGRPLQITPGTPIKRARATSALEIAVQTGNHALVYLLLSNGYDANQELRCPLDLALRARRLDLVNLLLEWGADPHDVDLGDLFDTYNSELFERFQGLGVDLTAGHALAESLAYHTSNRPLFGFAKRQRERNPKMQTELNIALARHASEGNERGVQLCLWAGADPHAPAIDLRYWRGSAHDGDANDGGDEIGVSAVYQACLRGNVEILKRLRPDPARDDFDRLYEVAGDRAVINLLAEHTLPKNVAAVIQHHLWWATLDRGQWRSTDTLRRLFEIGVRWTQSSPDEIANFRRSLLKASDSVFVDLLKLLATGDYCSTELLKDLARTPSMRARMQKLGFIPSPQNDSNRFNEPRPTRSREILKKFGVEIPKPREMPTLPLPRSIRIGLRRPEAREIRVDRKGLFERVWSEPVMKLAAEWGISGTGLKKVCRRLQIPVPPRGHWAKLKAGHRASRPQLRSLPEGDPQEIVILTSSRGDNDCEEEPGRTLRAIPEVLADAAP